MTRSQLNRAVARATGDEHDIICSRGFNLVDESAAIHDDDLEDVIADWDRIRAEEVQSRAAWSLSPTAQPRGTRRKKMTYIAT